MSKKSTMNRQSSLQLKKSDNINTVTNLFRATSDNSSDNKKTQIKLVYDDTNKQGLPKISKYPGLHRNHPALKPKKPKTKKNKAKPKTKKRKTTSSKKKKGGRRKRTRRRRRKKKHVRRRSRRRSRRRR